ncbi:MAG: lipid-A-disaccharide synthase [Ignavibacteria bacterium]
MYKIFIVVGEASGDNNAADLVRRILQKNNTIEFYGIGGKSLQDAGTKLFFEYSVLNYSGFTSVLKNYSKLKDVFKETIKIISDLKPDLLLLVDFPGFNLKLAKAVKETFNLPIIYYISPQLWAWHKSRIKFVKQYVDEMLVIFPFEVEFYSLEGVRAKYVGNPVLTRIENFLKNSRREESQTKRVTLLPGSRIGEIINILPVLTEVAKKLRADNNITFKLITPTTINKKEFINLIDTELISLEENNSQTYYQTLLNSDLVISKFGTASLEAALLGVPLISVYKTNFPNYLIAKIFARIQYVTLCNILAKEQIVKEFIQNQMTTENIYQEARKILFDSNYSDTIINKLKQVRTNLSNVEPDVNPEDIIIQYLTSAIH